MIGSDIAKLSGGGAQHAFATLQVDVIADLACPWSFLGKKRLDKALASVHGPSHVSWFPFQINPAMPEQGVPLEEYIAGRFGDPDKLQPAMNELVLIGKEQGIDFRFDQIRQVPNTLNAHRLMNLAEQRGVDTSSLAENILQGFFAKGLDISDIDVLAAIGADAGLGNKEILDSLSNDRSKTIVLSQEAQVRRSGVTGVPDFLINKRLLVIGPQDTENLVRVFDRAMFGDESDLPVSETLH